KLKETPIQKQCSVSDFIQCRNGCLPRKVRGHPIKNCPKFGVLKGVLKETPIQNQRSVRGKKHGYPLLSVPFLACHVLEVFEWVSASINSV
ncbi:hypothetical protein, partial [Pseudoalteromonas rubra]|uniref:hypothetical protein n=1 Tax=Pseudoalteromonas rubra TaxID=43658 RepID=UPI001A7E9234